MQFNSPQEVLRLEKALEKLCDKLEDAAVLEESVMEAAKAVLRPRHFHRIVEERWVQLRCGYPRCTNALPRSALYALSEEAAERAENVRGDYVEGKLYDVSELGYYCSNECFTQSTLYCSQLNGEPSHLRPEVPALLNALLPEEERLPLSQQQQPPAVAQQPLVIEEDSAALAAMDEESTHEEKERADAAGAQGEEDEHSSDEIVLDLGDSMEEAESDGEDASIGDGDSSYNNSNQEARSTKRRARSNRAVLGVPLVPRLWDLLSMWTRDASMKPQPPKESAEATKKTAEPDADDYGAALARALAATKAKKTGATEDASLVKPSLGPEEGRVLPEVLTERRTLLKKMMLGAVRSLLRYEEERETIVACTSAVGRLLSTFDFTASHGADSNGVLQGELFDYRSPLSLNLGHKELRVLAIVLLEASSAPLEAHDIGYYRERVADVKAYEWDILGSAFGGWKEK